MLPRRRMVLLGALQQALSQLVAVNAQLGTWQSQVAGLEAQLLQAAHHGHTPKHSHLQVCEPHQHQNCWVAGVAGKQAGCQGFTFFFCEGLLLIS